MEEETTCILEGSTWTTKSRSEEEKEYIRKKYIKPYRPSDQYTIQK